MREIIEHTPHEYPFNRTTVEVVIEIERQILKPIPIGLLESRIKAGEALKEEISGGLYDPREA